MKNKIDYTFTIPSDISITDFLTVLNDYKLDLKNSIPFGPAGGNPEITVSATSASIDSLKSFISNSN